MFYFKKNIVAIEAVESSHLFLYILFFFLILSCYHNTFQAEWHFDDIQNILLNSPLHLTDLNNDSIKQTFFAYPEKPGRLLRPVSNFSFALNWFFGQDKVFGYHLINFIIHFLVSIVLYRTCLLLLSSPVIKTKYEDSKFFIAALAAVLWAINPIQTQAVTYIVQRMAALAALFSIVTIFFYLKARIEYKKLFFFYSILSLLLAIGSKENAVIIPVSLVVIEIFFFRKEIRFNKQIVLFFITTIVAVLFFAILLMGYHFFADILKPYQNRTFTMLERILTQPRIILFYISLLLYPSPLRLSIEHDIQLSTSLFYPYTTFPAISIIAILFIAPFFFYKKLPLLSFSIVFFLLNHLVESSILNLELIFEHRNYLPSLFFFLPVAEVIYVGMEKYSKKNMAIILRSGVVALITLFSYATFLRNTVWLTDTQLWTDALKKAPQNSRPYINLGFNLQHEGHNQKAFELYHLSIDKYSSSPWIDRFRAYNGMANIMANIGRYDKSLLFLEQSIGVAKGRSDIMYSKSVFQKSKMLFFTRKHEESLYFLTNLIDKDQENKEYIQVYAEILILMGNYKKALSELRKIFSFHDFTNMPYKMALLDLSLIYAKMNMHEKANFYIKLAESSGSPKYPTLLCLLEQNVRAGNQSQTEQTFNQLLKEFTWPDLLLLLEQPHLDYPTLPVSYPLVRQYAVQWLAGQQ